jgi:lysozyme
MDRDIVVTNEARARLRAQLVVDEGLRLKPYTDTVGKLTIGVGRNLDDVGITKIEAMYLLENDINRAIRDLVAVFDWFPLLDPVRQCVLINMAFNMGIGTDKRGLRSFRNTLAAIARGDYAAAAVGMRKSKWAMQVGHRAERLAKMIETGRFPDEANA